MRTKYSPLKRMREFSFAVFLDTLMGYLKTYGDTIIFHDGLFSWLLLTIDYELNEFLYSSSVHIEKSDQYEFFHEWLGQGLLTSTGKSSLVTVRATCARFTDYLQVQHGKTTEK